MAELERHNGVAVIFPTLPASASQRWPQT